MGMGDIRGSGGVGIFVAAGMGRPLVLEPKAIQRIRREARLSSDHLQRGFRFLLQSPPARSLRDHPHSVQRVCIAFHFQQSNVFFFVWKEKKKKKLNSNLFVT